MNVPSRIFNLILDGGVVNLENFCRVKEKVLDIAPSLPSEPCIRLSPYTAQATS